MARSGLGRSGRALAAVAALLLAAPPTAAAGCDLSQVVGYTLVFARTIEAYIEGGRRHRGFSGCRPDRVLVFTDNTGLRCKVTSLQQATLPKGYLFARTETDLKLCVGDEMLDVAPAR